MDAASGGQPSSGVSPAVGEATTITDGDGIGRSHVSNIPVLLPHKNEVCWSSSRMHYYCQVRCILLCSS